MDRREMLSQLTAAAAGGSLLLTKSAAAGAARQDPAADYLAWSEKPGPTDEVQFKFGEPYLIASMKTDSSGLFDPHAFRGPDGAIYLGYFPYPDGYGTPEPFPAILLRSLDDGVTWRSMGERGSLGYFFVETTDKSVLAIDCQGSHDASGVYSVGAQVFTPDRPLKPKEARVKVTGFAPGAEPYLHFNRGVRAKNGTLVTAAYSSMGDNTYEMWYTTKKLQKPTRIVCLSSSDEGRSWKFLSDVALDKITKDYEDFYKRKIGLAEPFVEALPDGRLFCIFRDDRLHPDSPNRTHDRIMRQCWSSDSGASWSEPVSSGAVGVCPWLLQLKNGVLLCSFGRPGVRLMYSLDGGTHWKGHTSLYGYNRAAGTEGVAGDARVRRPWSHAYTSMVPLSEDRVLYFFDIHEHPMPWVGRLPDQPADVHKRSNSVFAVTVQVIRKV